MSKLTWASIVFMSLCLLGTALGCGVHDGDGKSVEFPVGKWVAEVESARSLLAAAKSISDPTLREQGVQIADAWLKHEVAYSFRGDGTGVIQYTDKSGVWHDGVKLTLRRSDRNSTWDILYAGRSNQSVSDTSVRLFGGKLYAAMRSLDSIETELILIPLN
ncbi:MAG: hypothetical protein JNM10_09820 [Planctomycetia bacterium]|nr:hypothetical protein [Planctomycetia bacterium]